jgi:hypothetical protein
VQLIEKEFRAISGNMFNQLQEKIKYEKLFFTTLSLEETSAPALIIEVLQKKNSLLLLLKILAALINLLDLFLDVINIQLELEKFSRNLLMHLESQVTNFVSA